MKKPKSLKAAFAAAAGAIGTGAAVVVVAHVAAPILAVAGGAAAGMYLWNKGTNGAETPPTLPKPRPKKGGKGPKQ